MEKPNRHAQKIAGVAALAHLGFVAAGALHVDVARAGRLPAFYAALSGTQGPYGFFAPGVRPELRATFQITDGAGGVTSDVLETAVSREATRRYKNLVTCFWLARDAAGAQIFTLSWAKRMFRRHPSAAAVTVRVEAYDPPSMEAWRNGARPAWRLHHAETFVRKPKLPANGSPPGGPS